MSVTTKPMFLSAKSTLPEQPDLTRNDWVMNGRWFSGFACSFFLIWTVATIVPLKPIPADDHLTRFDSTILQATDRYWKSKQSNQTARHRIEFTVVKPDGFKRYLALENCAFGKIMAADLVGRRAAVGMWGETLVSLDVDGRACIKLAVSRAARERELDQRAHMVPWFAGWTILAGLSFAALMRLKLDAPTESKT